MNKYQRWHNQIIERAAMRKSLACYCETHHIEPRSLNGDDRASNLVELTYREHFLVHWLLTKINFGGRLRKMQRAMLAMTLQIGGREIFGWQFSVARRAVRDLAVDPAIESAWRRNYTRHALMRQDVLRKREAAWVRARAGLREKNQRLVREIVSNKTRIEKAELRQLTGLFLKHSGKPKVKHSFRPRRVILPDGTTISLQKHRLKQESATKT